MTANSASEAIKKAGYAYATDNAACVEASRQLRKAHVRHAIAERRAELARNNEITVAAINAELLDAYALAAEQRRPGDMVSASMARAKLGGLLVDRREDVTALPDGELLARLYDAGVLLDLLDLHAQRTGERIELKRSPG